MESAKLHEDDPYLIEAPSEVLRILQDIHREQAFVTLLFPQDQKILTMLLAIDEEAGYMLYDVGRTQTETKAVLAASTVHFSSALNGITVRFIAPRPTEVIFEGRPAFRSPLPTALQYLQRREHFRTKVIRPASCTLSCPTALRPR